jgi:hypothetical protein
MSRASALREAIGHEVDSIWLSREVVQHGETGQIIEVTKADRRLSLFIADNRKVTEEQCVDIVRSYLSRLRDV